MSEKFDIVVVDGKEYGLIWQDFGGFKRLNVLRDGGLIGWRNLPIAVDNGYNTVRYLIRRMVIKDVAVYINC